MEPQDNKQLALRKAISAHEAAAASIADLSKDDVDPRYEPMLERIRQNLTDLQSASERSDPGETV